jgi:hypothetical protein
MRLDSLQIRAIRVLETWGVLARIDARLTGME